MDKYYGILKSRKKITVTSTKTKLMQTKNKNISFVFAIEKTPKRIGLILIFGVLTPLSAIFQLYHGDQF